MLPLKRVKTLLMLTRLLRTKLVQEVRQDMGEVLVNIAKKSVITEEIPLGLK